METTISNKVIEDMLSKYAKEVYKDDFDEVSVKVFKKNKSEPDGYGYYDTYLSLSGEINLEKNKSLFGKKLIISDKKSLDQEEITDIIRELLRKMMLKLIIFLLITKQMLYILKKKDYVIS